METVDIFTVSDLRQKTEELLQDAEKGRLALVTKQGRPAFLVVPFNDRLLGYGVNRTIAMYFFETGLVTLSQAAQIAGLSLEEFIELLGEVGISAVDYPPEELEEEIERARS